MKKSNNNNKNTLFLRVLEAGKFKIKTLAGLSSPESDLCFQDGTFNTVSSRGGHVFWTWQKGEKQKETKGPNSLGQALLYLYQPIY
jgi:hypothetical protein